MVFSSLIFLFLFLPLVLLGYYALPRSCKNSFLLLASLIFYFFGEPSFVFVMIGSALINYLLGLWGAACVRKEGSCRAVIAVTVFLNVGLLFVYKYLNFTIKNLNLLFDGFIEPTSILLPIGISFFTFQAMSYVFDVCAKNAEVQKNPFNVLLYVSLFPQLIAGPIVRYQTVAHELNHRQENVSDFILGARRFVLGLCKKVIIADTLALPADQIFDAFLTGGADVSMGVAWIGAICYTLQIFFDFSGYSDMAIGLGLMFGFHFKENFNYPYISQSISEFWRRWHISMGTWFRDYVYYPLGGSRVGTQSRLIFNLFVVWLLTGIWHGANWTFIAWGMMYFVLIAAEKLTGYPDRFKHAVFKLLYRIFTLLCIVLGWVIFRSADLPQAGLYIKQMFTLDANSFGPTDMFYHWLNYWRFIALGVLCSIPFLKPFKLWILRKWGETPLDILGFIGFILLLFCAFVFCVASTYEAFIYFNF